MSHFLFAYGTLQPKKAPPEMREAVKALKPVAKGSVRGELYDLGQYPGAVFQNGTNGRVIGTVLRLPRRKDLNDHILRVLDDYEGVDPDNPKRGLFVRREMPVRTRNGRRLKCWVYEFNGDPGEGKLIPSGQFSRYS